MYLVIFGGYAERFNEVEIQKVSARIWDLLIFVVLHVNNPEKLWIVWDVFAKSPAVCLNDFLFIRADQK